MLKQVHFAGIKSLLDVTIDLEPFTVLVGPNGCGKSTVLDQVEVLCRASQPLRNEVQALGSAGEALAEIGPYEARTTGLLGEMRWIGKSDAGDVLSVVVGPAANGAWARASKVVAQVGDASATLDMTSAAQPNRVAFEDVLGHDFNWRAQRLRLVPASIARPSPMTDTSLRPDGFGLATVLKDLATDDTQAYLNLQRDLSVVVPHFRSLKIPKSESTHRISFVMHGAGEVPATRISDGTLTALALLTATHNRALPSLVLMDDIDHGLHLTAQYELIKAIRAVMAVRPELQIICTTHSPILLDSFEPKEVRVMALDKEGHTRVRPLTALPDFEKHRRGLQTGELWASSGEDWVAEAAPNG